MMRADMGKYTPVHASFEGIYDQLLNARVISERADYDQLHEKRFKSYGPILLPSSYARGYDVQQCKICM